MLQIGRERASERATLATATHLFREIFIYQHLAFGNDRKYHKWQMAEALPL